MKVLIFSVYYKKNQKQSRLRLIIFVSAWFVSSWEKYMQISLHDNASFSVYMFKF